LSDVIIGSIPEAKNGVTGLHIFALMMEVEKHSNKDSIPLIGHCTDSASNSLRALVTLASPKSYKGLKGMVRFLGLKMKGFVFFSPVLREDFPSIAYPCWDHCGRTSIRNLMNTKLTIVAEIIPSQSKADNCLKYSVATIQDLRALKKLNPNSVVRQADITPHVRQNCDATVRVLSRATLQEIETHLPSAKATQLYLQASIWILEPFRNEKFGSPPEVVKSLWAGIMTWRRWRRYVGVTEGLTLADNFISRIHYLTLELMAHAGILHHQLALFLSFPDLGVKDYNLCWTGNRNIEAIHSIF